MKKVLFFLLVAVSTTLFTSCSLIKDDGPNELSGKTDIPMNEVGNEITPGWLTIDGQSVPVDASLTITESDDGEVVAQLEIDVQQFTDLPGYQEAADAVPDRYKDSNGNISTELKFKSTDEGILDYNNMDGEGHTLVKYSDPVGTTYEIEKSNGRTLTREVVAKSSDDDFPYGFMYIKTSTVEMEVNSGGVRSVKYRANHKFGIVHVEATLDDGSKASSYLYASAVE